MISKFYYFKGDHVAQMEKLKEIRSKVSGQLRQYPDCMTFMAMFGGEDQTIKDESVEDVKIGFPKWRYYFEQAREHLIDLKALDGGDLAEAQRIVELKIGNKLTNEGDGMFSCVGTRETSVDFYMRMKSSLDLNDQSEFRHRGKKFSFELSKPKE